MPRLRPFYFLLLLTLTACAGPVTMSPQGSNLEIRKEAEKQKALVFKKIVSDQDRLFNISFPIQKANADFCRNTAPALGMTVWNLSTVGASFARAAQQNYNLQEALTAQYVADHSPAAKAGLQSGDFIISVNGQKLPSGIPGAKAYVSAMRAAKYNPVDIIYERGGKTVQTVVLPVKTCDAPVLLDFNSNDINAYTDGQKIVVSKGIVRFAENDNELALVIAHELGHVAMNHVNKMKQNAIAGSLGGLAVDSLLAAAGVNSGGQFSQIGGDIGATSYSIAFEQEADYVGMYFMERAGYNSSGVADFWRRMAAENAAAISTRHSHPTSPERFLAIERIHAEITGKKSRKQSLTPNIKQK